MLLNRTHKIAAVYEQICLLTPSYFAAFFSYTISLVSLGDSILSFSISMASTHIDQIVFYGTHKPPRFGQLGPGKQTDGRTDRQTDRPVSVWNVRSTLHTPHTGRTLFFFLPFTFQDRESSSSLSAASGSKLDFFFTPSRSFSFSACDFVVNSIALSSTFFCLALLLRAARGVGFFNLHLGLLKSGSGRS